MSSTNKTTNYQLNNWLGSDIPERSDFNADNLAIDTALNNHENDSVAHITATERATWNMPYHVGIYYGNGTANRRVATNCPFDPVFGFVFAIDWPIRKTDFSSSVNYNMFSIVTETGGTIGAELDGTDLIVTTSINAVVANETQALNNNTVTYAYILFR